MQKSDKLQVEHSTGHVFSMSQCHEKKRKAWVWVLFQTKRDSRDITTHEMCDSLVDPSLNSYRKHFWEWASVLVQAGITKNHRDFGI